MPSLKSVHGKWESRSWTPAPGPGPFSTSPWRLCLQPGFPKPPWVSSQGNQVSVSRVPNTDVELIRQINNTCKRLPSCWVVVFLFYFLFTLYLINGENKVICDKPWALSFFVTFSSWLCFIMESVNIFLKIKQTCVWWMQAVIFHHHQGMQSASSWVAETRQPPSWAGKTQPLDYNQTGLRLT